MKSDLELLRYVLEQIDILLGFVDGKDEELFLRDAVLKDACLMKLVVIGEYSSKISTGLKERFTEVEWQLLKAARNFFAHAYGAITWVRVWDAVSNDVPPLKEKIERIIEVLENEQDGKIN